MDNSICWKKPGLFDYDLTQHMQSAEHRLPNKNKKNKIFRYIFFYNSVQSKIVEAQTGVMAILVTSGIS